MIRSALAVSMALTMAIPGVTWPAPIKKSDDRQLRARPYEPCLQQAATEHQVPITLLTAIVHVENGHWNPLAISINHKGKGTLQPVKSSEEARALVTRLWLQNINFDVGLGQVNTVNMERYRIHPVALLDPCTNLSYSARILRESINRHGYNWLAIEGYNGINPSYPWKVKNMLDVLREGMR